MTAEIRVLSGGAVEPGLARVLRAFQHETGHRVTTVFATAPEIHKRMSAGAAVDVLIAPADLLDELVRSDRLADPERVNVGRIGVGVTVRADAALPAIATVDQLKQSLLEAESVVYNQASTGIYLESLFERLGIAAELRAKTTRYPDAASVLRHVAGGTGREIGLGATTVIIEGLSKGLQFAGPLPAEIQNYTTYDAAAVATGSGAAPARALVRFIATAAAKEELAAAGIESAAERAGGPKKRQGMAPNGQR